MAKVIAEKVLDVVEAAAVAVKQVEIKYTKVMQNAAGNNVTVIDYTEVRPVDELITQAEAELANAEALVISLAEDIAAYKVIKG
tara:strand:- start:281 stop:532 length:252 start_codon:yes stop_codon:yes gene_type:complete